MRVTLTQAEEIAHSSEGYWLNAERIEQEAAAPDGTLAVDLRSPFGPTLATMLAVLPDWGPTPIVTEQQAKTP